MKDNVDSGDKLINRLWEEHYNAPFPEGIVGEDINGIDCVLLDADIAGCVSTYVSLGTLNFSQVAVLGLCYRDAVVVQQEMNEIGKDYFRHLEKLAELILKAVARRNQSQHLRDQ